MVAVDRVCHALYGQMSHPRHHGRDGRADWKYSGEVLRAYQAVDRALGELLRELGDDTVVIVMSDHGFGSLKRDVSLNQLFLEQDLVGGHRFLGIHIVFVNVDQDVDHVFVHGSLPGEEREASDDVRLRRRVGPVKAGYGSTIGIFQLV